jgi:hypothetical protein
MSVMKRKLALNRVGPKIFPGYDNLVYALRQISPRTSHYAFHVYVLKITCDHKEVSHDKAVI